MADLSTYLVPNLISGVSQQADAQRNPAQAEVQINGVSSITEGLRKREGTQLLARLGDDGMGSVMVHVISRDQSERYLALFLPGDIQVFDFAGTPVSLDKAAGLPYLASATDPRQQIRATTLADYTFVVNTEVKPRMKADTAPKTPRPKPHEALIFVQAAQYGQDYVVSVNGQTATVSTPVSAVQVNPSDPTQTTENRISAEDIAENILQALSGKTTGVTWARTGAVLWLQSDSVIEVGARSTLGGSQAIYAITDRMRSFTELPAVAPNGYQVYLEGDPTNELDDYYVEFRVRDGQGDFGEGSWLETVAPGVAYAVEPSSMPHVLVRLPDGSFWFGPADGRTLQGVEIPTWGERTAGDLVSSPDPTFIGRSIRDVFVWRNRLGLLSDEAVILSRPGEFFDFFPESVATTLASDPIDLLASGNQVSILRYAMVFQDELVVFADQTQFRLSSQGGPLSAETASFAVLTRYEIDVNCRPIQVGPNVVFAQANGEWSRFREYRLRTDGLAILADAEDLTEAVPSYVPSETFRLHAEQTSNSWYALSRAEGYRNRLWVNKYLLRNVGDGTQRQQNAWSEWRFTVDQILDFATYDETLFLVTELAGGTWLESMPITDPSPVARKLPLGLLLDGWMASRPSAAPTVHLLPRSAAVDVAAGTYDRDANTTTWTLPAPVGPGWEAWSALDTSLGTHFLGTVETAGTFTAQNDWSDKVVVFGRPIEFRYRMTRFKAYQNVNDGLVARNAYRTQIRKAVLRYHDSEYFEAHVFLEGRRPAVYRFAPTPRHRNNLVGRPAWDYEQYEADAWQRQGVFSIPIQSRGDQAQVELRSRVPRPCKFVSVEWVGLVTSKARR